MVALLLNLGGAVWRVWDLRGILQEDVSGLGHAMGSCPGPGLPGRDGDGPKRSCQLPVMLCLAQCYLLDRSTAEGSLRCCIASVGRIRAGPKGGHDDMGVSGPTVAKGHKVDRDSQGP